MEDKVMRVLSILNVLSNLFTNMRWKCQSILWKNEKIVWPDGKKFHEVVQETNNTLNEKRNAFDHLASHIAENHLNIDRILTGAVC